MDDGWGKRVRDLHTWTFSYGRVKGWGVRDKGRRTIRLSLAPRSVVGVQREDV